MRSFFKWLNCSSKLKSRERSILRPVTPATSLAEPQQVPPVAPSVSFVPPNFTSARRSKLRPRSLLGSVRLHRPHQDVVARDGREPMSKRNPNSSANASSNTRHLPKWAFQLLPSRWTRGKRLRRDQGPPECYASHTANRSILEACVRHAEEDVYHHHRSRASTHFLLGGSRSPPPMVSETCITTPPFDTDALIEYGRAHATSLESRASWDIPRRRDRTSIGLPLPSTSTQLPRISASSPPAPSSPPRRRNTLVVLRSPHPPSSFASGPLNFNHSRQSSQTQTQPRFSTCSSTVDHDAYKIGSFSNSSLGGRNSPLFYSTEDSTDTAIQSPAHRNPAHFQSQLPPIPGTPTTPIARAFSAPASSGAYQAPKRCIEAPIGTPIARSGSLTISIRTENGQEDLEFPCPPTRWSGYWLAGKEPDLSNHGSQPLSAEGSRSGSGSRGSLSETDMEDNTSPHFDFRGRARFPSTSTSSYGASLATPTTPTTPTTRTKTIPHMHTFGLGAASQLSLSAHKSPISRENYRSYHDHRHVDTNASIHSSVDTSLGSVTGSVSHDGEDADVSRSTHMEDEEYESMDSVCSVFLDVHMHHRGPSFDSPHALSDTDSVADPVFIPMRST